MSAERQYTQPEIGSEELQEMLERACAIYMEADVIAERAIKKRAIAWEAFNFLRSKLGVEKRLR